MMDTWMEGYYQGERFCLELRPDEGEAELRAYLRERLGDDRIEVTRWGRMPTDAVRGELSRFLRRSLTC